MMLAHFMLESGVDPDTYCAMIPPTYVPRNYTAEDILQMSTFLDPAQPSIAKLRGVLKRNVPSSSRKRLPEPAQRRVEPLAKRPRARRVLID